jgi:hypothetical protein
MVNSCRITQPGELRLRSNTGALNSCNERGLFTQVPRRILGSPHPARPRSRALSPLPAYPILFPMHVLPPADRGYALFNTKHSPYG